MTKAIEITDFPKTDYQSLVRYEKWRVAVLAACENTTLPKIKAMQKHDETDEVFVLVCGNCTLITAGNDEAPGEITIHKMQPQKVYNVKKGFWHNHILDDEGVVVIIENEDTCDANSPVLPLTKEQLLQLEAIVSAAL